MGKVSEIIKKIYIRTSGYSYTNLGRLFLRLFVGLMLIQFGVRQIMDFETMNASFPSVLGMSSQCSLIMMICIEMVCSVFIMFGFLTRIMTLPPFIAMIIAETYLLHDKVAYLMTWQSHGYLPIMFSGIYFFILLVGPGKISVDYFLSLYFIHSEDKNETDELEEV
ncbi:MAG: DoxX family protein [Muribaculaceae bacterium]|nr:DoxX family protein [Muribaculaceae bacterium]